MLADGPLFVNVMASPGAGKTTLLVRTIRALRDRFRLGVIEADADGDVDARTVAAAGARALQMHTGGSCHTDALMAAQSLEALGWRDLDLIFLENIGNLVCPAEFDTGADLNAVLLSVPEGDDKPLKYPLMFTVADVLLVTKCDAAPLFDFDTEALAQRARALNPGLAVIPVSAVTGEGLDAWLDWLCAAVKAKRLNAEAPAEAASEGRIGREGH